MKNNNKTIRRINFFAGPCASKSTTAAHVFSYLKTLNYNIELVTEYIKFWTYIPREPKGFDQLYIFAKQISREDVVLRSGINYIVSDSPIFLSYFYSMINNVSCNKQLLEISQQFEKIYPSLNIFLKRKDRDFINSGRFHNLEQSKGIDIVLKEILNKNNIKFKEFSYYDKEKIIDYIIKNIKK